jgi:hypothetical protein
MSHTIWDEGREPGGRVIALSVALALTVAVIDSRLAGHVEALFDVCFVLICIGVALLVHPRDFFAVGVLPPLLMMGVFVLFAVGSREGIARADDGFLQSVVSALGHHSAALFVGYALALACLAIRRGRASEDPQPVSPRSGTSRPRPHASPRALPPTSR